MERLMETKQVTFEFFRMIENNRRFGKLFIPFVRKSKGKHHKIFLLDDLAESGRTKLKDIAARTGHSPQNLCMLYNALEKEGLVAREVDPANRRNTYYSVTPAGRSVLEESKQEARETVQALFARISEKNLNLLKASLEQTNMIFEKVLQEIDR